MADAALHVLFTLFQAGRHAEMAAQDALPALAARPLCDGARFADDLLVLLQA
jgi:hypothetical protein